MKILDKVDPKLVEAFSEALKGVGLVVAVIVVLGAWIIIIGVSFNLSIVFGIISLIAAMIFGATVINYFD